MRIFNASMYLHKIFINFIYTFFGVFENTYKKIKGTNMRKILLLGGMALLLIGCDVTSEQRTVDYLTTSNGESLYIFDEDELNKSNCDEDCQQRWTKVIDLSKVGIGSPDIKRIEDGQLAYRTHPLYTFNKDEEPGDVKGDNFRDVWHLIYAPNNLGFALGLGHKAPEPASMKQRYLTDKDGRALYTFDKDDNGDSHCYAGCENIWPVYYEKVIHSVPASVKKSDFGTINRDKSKVVSGQFLQTTYKGLPLYYFHKDLNQAHSTKGDWIDGLWDLIELDAHKTDEQAGALPDLPQKVSNANLTDEAKLGRDLFYNPKRGFCFKCHGNRAQNQPPSIKGVPINNVIARFGDKETIKERLLDMKNNPDSGRDPSMIIGAKILTDEEIENVSAFIATLKTYEENTTKLKTDEETNLDEGNTTRP